MSEISRAVESLPPKKRALFQALLKKKKEERRLQESIIPHREESDSISLSFAQQQWWFLDQLMPGSPAYNSNIAIRLTGSLNVAALEQSHNEIFQRHEILRTTFATVDGQPVQVIAPALAKKLLVVDLQELPETEREAHARRLATEETRRPFDLTRGPLFRASLLRLGEEAHVLLLVFHHVIFDGWSGGVLARELVTLYEAFLGGKPSPLPELPIQYADFAQWQRQSLQTGELKEALVYWKQQLAGHLPILELVTDHSHPTGIAPKVVRQTCALGTSMTEELKALSRRERVTLFVIILAAFKTLLYRFTGQTDIIVGLPMADRNRTEIQEMIGPFLNTLVLRTDLSGDPTFLELLGRVRQVVQEAFAHRDLPFERLVQELRPERDLNRNPLFQVVFVERTVPMVSLELSGLRASLFPGDFKLDEAPDLLGIRIEDTKEGIISSLERRADILNQNILGHFQTLLQGIVSNPNQRLSALLLLTEAERHQVLVEWNATETEYPQKQCIHELFEAQVAQTPDAVVVVFEDGHLTYQELNRRSNQLAHHLRKLGVGPEVLVGISMERSLEMVVGLMGILKAGGAYVPLDPTYPKERLAFMLEDARVPVLLTQEQVLENLPKYGAQVVCLDTGWEAIAEESGENPVHEVTDSNLAYVIYTSGSTGRPKGAMNTHGGIRNRLLWKQETYQLAEVDRVPQKTPFSFDVSVWEFFWPLLTGACLVVARPEGHKDSAYLVKLIVEQDITTMHFVPSMLQVFVEEEGLEACDSLKRVICSGEALPFDLQERFFARLDAELHNLYGPTEAAVDVTFWACEREGQQRVVPIGRPIANTQIYLLNPHLQPVPVGVPGELHIGGVGLARGYWNRPRLTAGKFIPDPFPPSIPPIGGEEAPSIPPNRGEEAPSIPPIGGEERGGARLYKTGDLACYLPDGNIRFLGRIDYQVKVRGFRIELGEIEAVLRQSPAVREIVVTARDVERVPGDSSAEFIPSGAEGLKTDKQLVAYVVPHQEQIPTPDHLSKLARKQLPDYMVPSAFVLLDTLPLTPNGKVDRRALPAPDASQLARRTEFVAPETPLEKRLAKIWADFLVVEQIGIHDDFFDLGGHSLLAIQIINHIGKVFGVDLSVRRLFREESTIAGLALLVEEALIEKLEEGARRRASEANESINELNA